MNEKQLIEEFNKTQNKSLLPNDGLRTEKIIFKQRITIGKAIEKNSYGMEQSYNIYLDAEIKEIDLSTQAIYKRDYKTQLYKLIRIGSKHKTQDLKNVSKYRILSISGTSHNFGGQIYDMLINPSEDMKIHKKDRVAEIVKIWREWHLNDMHAGTDKQEALIKSKLKNYEYDTACQILKENGLYEDRGYKYGHAWLLRALPQEVQEKIISLFSTF